VSVDARKRAAESVRKPSSAANDTEYDKSGKQLSYAIETMGPLILAIKTKFDERSTSENMLLNKDAFIGMLPGYHCYLFLSLVSFMCVCVCSALCMDLKMKGQPLARAVSALERRENIFGLNQKGIEFPVFISLYSYHCGLRPPVGEDAQDDGAMWLPTVHGEWKKVSPRLMHSPLS
jgi:hypothetical protein